MKPGGKRSLASRVTISDPSDYQEIEREVEAKAPRAQTWTAGEKAAVEQGPPSGAFGLLFDAIDASGLGASSQPAASATANGLYDALQLQQQQQTPAQIPEPTAPVARTTSTSTAPAPVGPSPAPGHASATAALDQAPALRVDSTPLYPQRGYEDGSEDEDEDDATTADETNDFPGSKQQAGSAIFAAKGGVPMVQVSIFSAPRELSANGAVVGDALAGKEPEGGDSSTSSSGGSGLHRPCSACRTAKVRCNREMPCSRCRRLGFTCAPPPTVPRGRPSHYSKLLQLRDAPGGAAASQDPAQPAGAFTPGLAIVGGAAGEAPSPVPPGTSEAAQEMRRKVEALRAQLLQLGVQPCV